MYKFSLPATYLEPLLKFLGAELDGNGVLDTAPALITTRQEDNVPFIVDIRS